MVDRRTRSTKRSGGKNSEKQPEPAVFFLDENFSSKSVLKTLRAKGVRVESSADHFPAGTPDDVWIPSVVARGWIILTRDAKIRHRHNEREALVRSGARVFVFTGGNVRGIRESEDEPDDAWGG